MASTVFIAVQCCECSMMQVKQQKKSSNKWTCVVCNQKQSVRKVFAQGYTAKDLRQFVQSFNMGQKDQTLAQERGEFESRIETEKPNKKLKLSNDEGDSRIFRPTKWSKYLSQDDTEREQRSLAMAALKWENHGQQTQQPSEPVGASKKWDHYLAEDDGQQRTQRAIMATPSQATSKWDDYMTQADGEQRTHRPTTMTKSATKWERYLTKEEEGEQRSNGDFETITHDQEVEDEIHPDFI